MGSPTAQTVSLMRWQRVFRSSLSFSELQQRANFQTTFKDSEGVADVGCGRWLLLPLHVTSRTFFCTRSS